MSILEMKVPSPGESITEVEIATWLVKDGDYVEKDQAIAEVDSDKATLELPAEASGIITLKASEGDAVAVGAVVCLIDTSAAKPNGSATVAEAKPAVEAPKVEEVKMETETITTPMIEDTIVNIDEPKEEQEVFQLEEEASDSFKKINRRGLISSLTEKLGNWIKSDVDDFNDVK